jgi:nicotinamide riboside kinase
MKKFKVTTYNLDDVRCVEINKQREKLLKEYDRLICLKSESIGWEKVDYEEQMSKISEELHELNNEYESLTFCILE